jgi:hypothetical protein
MHRDPGMQRRCLAVERSEEVDRDPGGQSSGQGQRQLHREPAVLPADFLARTLELNPHPILLDLFSGMTACCPPARPGVDLRGGALDRPGCQVYMKINL